MSVLKMWRRGHPFALLGLLALSLVGWGTDVHAESPAGQRAVLWLQHRAKLRGPMAKQLPRAIIAGMAKSGWQVLEPDKKQTKMLKRLERKCDGLGGNACQTQAANIVASPLLLLVKVSGKPKSQTLRLELWDTRSGTRAVHEGAIAKKTWKQDASAHLATLVDRLAQPAKSAEPKPASTDESSAVAASTDTDEVQPPIEPVASSADNSTDSEEVGRAVGAADSEDELALTPVTTTAAEARNDEGLAAEAIQAPSAATAESTAGEASGDTSEPLTTGESKVEASPVSARSLGLSIAVGPLLVVPTPDINTTAGGSIELIYFLPLFTDLDMRHIFAVSLEAGWYPLYGHDKDSFSEFDVDATGTDYVTTEYKIAWDIQTVPVCLGVMARLPTEKILSLLGLEHLPLAPELFARAGATMAYGRAEARLRLPGEAPFAEGNTNSDLAWGGFFAIGGGLHLGPGAVMVEYRISNARLDFDLPQWNPEMGDLGGSTWRAGYRFDF
ncbi:MAG: hypothetical protein A2341_02680 [Deltaproteobacteria bacterium RIFOXYB12_FULL_58_9]|nr:MAG: hypothetical protein A2341_02680 [Deltaproteobacteria bacterium RIFOXYB12_FULL_58_9]